MKEKLELINLIIRRLPDVQFTRLDLKEEVRFEWRDVIYRVTIYLGVDEVEGEEPASMAKSDRAKLIQIILKSSGED